MSSCIWLQFCCPEYNQVYVGEFTKPMLFLVGPGSNHKGKSEFRSQKQRNILFPFVPISSFDIGLL